jgi:hypothetical protein
MPSAGTNNAANPKRQFKRVLFHGRMQRGSILDNHAPRFHPQQVPPFLENKTQRKRNILSKNLKTKS